MTPQTSFIDFLSVFGFGVVMSFTPCVYPLVPITVSIIIPAAGGSRLRGFFLSFIYVLGVAVTYSVLGLIAALTGSLFGRISTHPVAQAVVGSVCILFGLVLLEVVRIPLPVFSVAKTTPAKSAFTIFLLGLVSGLAVGPCTAPALGSILVYVASRQNIIAGAMLLFTFAFGMGFLLILAGTFSGIMMALPKSGKWLVLVKKVCGFFLIAAGIFFLLKAGRFIV